ncbi:MAG: LCP family protein [Clostridia bacterium]|nr:LCP family protein [Clostridia bacterium]
MSDSKKNDNMQDYLDLLNQYAPVNDEITEEKPQISQTEADSAPKKINTEAINDVVDADFFEGEKEKSDIESFFETEKKEQAQKSPAPPPVVEKKEKKKLTFKRLSDWFNNLPKKKKIIVSIIAVLLAIAIVLSAAAGIFVAKKFSLMGDNIDYAGDDVIYEEEEIADIDIDIGSAGFKQSLIDWATNGNDRHMSSKNVINVLLIGADSRKGKNEGNTDVMMLVSVNRKTKTLKMVSFLRDSYLYVEGDSSSHCTKLNAAYSMGGPECLIKTIENNYKIEIDNYVMVNFESFKAIIDAMGGITVDVQEYEAKYIERTLKTPMPVGDGVTLNGKQALSFCRVRGCDADGDVSRTRRQRQVIDSMVSRVTSSSIGEINKYIDVLLPYVDTGYSKSQIISLGLKAITGGWAKYERTQLSMPSENCRTSGSANMWIWVVDYEKAAHDLQMELYGDSNITLKDDRVSIIDVYRGANYTGPSSTIKNPDNGETEVPDTTTPLTTAPQTTDNIIGEEPTIGNETEPDNTTEATEPDTEPIIDPEPPTQQETSADTGNESTEAADE